MEATTQNPTRLFPSLCGRIQTFYRDVYDSIDDDTKNQGWIVQSQLLRKAVLRCLKQNLAEPDYEAYVVIANNLMNVYTRLTRHEFKTLEEKLPSYFLDLAINPYEEFVDGDAPLVHRNWAELSARLIATRHERHEPLELTGYPMQTFGELIDRLERYTDSPEDKQLLALALEFQSWGWQVRPAPPKPSL